MSEEYRFVDEVEQVRRFGRRVDWDERQTLEEHFNSTPNVIAIGAVSGEIRLQIDYDKDPLVRKWIDDICIITGTVSRTTANSPSAEKPVIKYHAVATGFKRLQTDEEIGFHTSKAFGHSRSALGWLERTIPDFDLLPVAVFCGSTRAWDSRTDNSSRAFGCWR